MTFFNNTDNDKSYCLSYDNDIFPLKYKIKLITNAVINDNVCNEVETDIEWQINSWKSNEEGFVVQFDSNKHELVKCSPSFEDMKDMFLMFNYPLKNLSLQLNRQGLPISVLNQEEIYRKWIELRVNKFQGFENNEDTKGVIIGGEIDFSKSLPVINSSLIYILFFSPVFGKREKTKSVIQSIVQDSQFFPQNEIKINIYESLTNISDSDIELIHVANGELQEYIKAEELYNASFRKITEKSFCYDYSMKADYKINHNGILTHCFAIIKEQADESILSQQIFDINLIP